MENRIYEKDINYTKTINNDFIERMRLEIFNHQLIEIKNDIVTYTDSDEEYTKALQEKKKLLKNKIKEKQTILYNSIRSKLDTNNLIVTRLSYDLDIMAVIEFPIEATEENKFKYIMEYDEDLEKFYLMEA